MSISYPNSIKLLLELSTKTAINYQKFRTEFPKLKENDIRRSTYGMCANTVESILFSSIFQQEQLTDPEWYKKIPYLKNVKSSNIQTVQHVYDSFLKVGFVTEYFSIFEHFFRVLNKKINTNSKKKDAWEIIKEMLQEFDLQDQQRIFDFYRFIRNTLHNNGMITDKYTYPIVYKGNRYPLELGTLIIVDWALLCNLSWDMQQCMEKIIYSDKICSESEILDTSFPEENYGYQTHDANQFLSS